MVKELGDHSFKESDFLILRHMLRMYPANLESSSKTCLGTEAHGASPAISVSWEAVVSRCHSSEHPGQLSSAESLGS